MEESESRDKICRTKVENFISKSKTGKAIDVTVSLVSIISSVAFIVFTSYDLRYLNPCCQAALEQYADYVSSNEAEFAITGSTELEVMDENTYLMIHGECPEPDPPCYEYYHNNRMPEIFEVVDTPVCVIYATLYFLNLYIAINRCQFFIEL